MIISARCKEQLLISTLHRLGAFSILGHRVLHRKLRPDKEVLSLWCMRLTGLNAIATWASIESSSFLCLRAPCTGNEKASDQPIKLIWSYLGSSLLLHLADSFILLTMTISPNQPVQVLKKKGDDKEGLFGRPWHLLSRSLSFQSMDHRKWWEKLGPSIGAHLETLQYSTGAQYQYLLLMHSTIFPTLGPFPNQERTNLPWPSCLPGNGEPWEVSVNYQQNAAPCLRIVFEPSGPDAGYVRDPVNEHAGRRVLEELCQIQPQIDLSLFNQFERFISLSNAEARQHWDVIKPNRIKTQLTVSLDLHETSFKVKPYMVPGLRSMATGVDPLQVIMNSLKECPFTASIPGLSKLDDFFASIRHPLRQEMTFFSFDCEAPESSRIKVYTGADMTTLSDVHDFWTMGGRVQGEEIDKGFDIVKTIWDIAFSTPLPGGRQRESMTLCWNWESSPCSPDPAAKAYFGFFENYDQQVTEALTALFAKLGWSENVKTHSSIQNKA